MNDRFLKWVWNHPGWVFAIPLIGGSTAAVIVFVTCVCYS